MAGYGIQVQTNTGRKVWVTETGTASVKTAKGVLKFGSESGAEMYRNVLLRGNPSAIITVKKF